ncbi:hypothetical protein SLA2020_400540 [Shorea laevis]
MGKGLPSTPILNFVMEKFYNQFAGKEIKDFCDFHMAILDLFNTINSALPGKHYDVPSRKEVEACFKAWKKAEVQEEKRKVFVNFINERVNLNVDQPMVITGIITPPAAMLAKRAGEKVSQLKAIKAIPDVLFVPSTAVLALIYVKFSRRLFMDKIC